MASFVFVDETQMVTIAVRAFTLLSAYEKLFELIGQRNLNQWKFTIKR